MSPNSVAIRISGIVLPMYSPIRGSPASSRSKLKIADLGGGVDQQQEHDGKAEKLDPLPLAQAREFLLEPLHGGDWTPG